MQRAVLGRIVNLTNDGVKSAHEKIQQTRTGLTEVAAVVDNLQEQNVRILEALDGLEGSAEKIRQAGIMIADQQELQYEILNKKIDWYVEGQFKF